MTERFVSPFARFFTSDLKTLPGAKLYFYENGTTTPKTTYQDPFKTNAHANPVVAGSLGYAADTFPPIFLDGTYTVELRNSAEVVQAGWPVNNVGGEQVDGAFDPYSPIISFLAGQIVTGSNGLYYVSQQNGNLNRDPTISANRPTWWVELKLSPIYNAASSYAAGEWTLYSGDWYKCKAPATGQTPSLNSAFWDAEKVVFQWNSTTTYGDGAHAFVGEDEYVSQQATNLNHNPVGDSGAWWKPQWQTIQAFNEVLRLTGGGNLTARFSHELNDSSTYTIPLASSVPAGTVLIAGKTDQFKGQNPVAQRSGSDVIRYGGGTDTAIRFSAPYAHSQRLVSNGSNEWSI